MLSLILAATLGQGIRHCQPVRVQQARAYAAPVQYQQVQAVYQNAYPYVEKAAFVAVEQVPYYSALVGGEQRGQIRLQEQAEREKALTDQIGRLSDEVAKVGAALAKANGTTPTPPNPQQPPPDPTPAVPVPNPPVDPNIAAIREKAIGVMTAKCAKCHTAPVKDDGFVIFEAPGKLRKMPAIDKLAIDHQTYSGEMPQGGPALEADDYSALAAWVHADPDLPSAIKACRDKAAGKKTN
jgi:hypothetical protein